MPPCPFIVPKTGQQCNKTARVHTFCSQHHKTKQAERYYAEHADDDVQATPEKPKRKTAVVKVQSAAPVRTKKLPAVEEDSDDSEISGDYDSESDDAQHQRQVTNRAKPAASIKQVNRAMRKASINEDAPQVITPRAAKQAPVRRTKSSRVIPQESEADRIFSAIAADLQ